LLQRNFGNFDKLMSDISSIASLMCRRQCMLTELKELTAWLNVKDLQQSKQQQQQQPPRWLQNAISKHNQSKLEHHRRKMNITVIKQTTFENNSGRTNKPSRRAINIVFATYVVMERRIRVNSYSLTDGVHRNMVTAISLIFYSNLVVIYTHIFLLKILTYNLQRNCVCVYLLSCIDYTSKERNKSLILDQSLKQNNYDIYKTVFERQFFKQKKASCKKIELESNCK
jgi:hypothetical protein